MSPGAEIRSEFQARAILKLAADAPSSTWRAAFQREAKAAHPDRGGDSERMRLVIEAYRFLKTMGVSGHAPRPEPRPRPRSTNWRGWAPTFAPLWCDRLSAPCTEPPPPSAASENTFH